MAYKENSVDLSQTYLTEIEILDSWVGGQLWACGYANGHLLGTGDLTVRSSPVQTAVGGNNWKSVSLGVNRWPSAAIKADGTLWTWGLNGSGELGTNSDVTSSTPVQTICGGTNWKQVSGCSGTLAAVKTDGTLWMCGYNPQGQLGDNSTTPKSSPVQTVAGGTDWKQVSCGYVYPLYANHSIAAVKYDGTLWTWGGNGGGCLGDGTTTNRSSPVQTVAGGTDWKQVSVGTGVMGAIKTDGTLWMWGGGDGSGYNNRFRLLGGAVSTFVSSPVQTVAGGTNWKQVSVGYYHVAAIKTDGTLWTWGGSPAGGGSTAGELGDNSTVDKSSPVQTICGGTNWRQVSAGMNMTAAIKTDGTLWTWGIGDGALATNDVIDRSSPVQTIVGGNNWKDVKIGAALFAISYEDQQ
jgi:alpha-tubulin suppressor-like RCC1 family protein